MVDFHQIYYKDEHKEHLFPFATPYYNERLTIYFENSAIVSVVKASEGEKIAVCSWKLKDKLRKRVGVRTPLTLEALNMNFQVLSFTRNTQNHHMMARAKAWHPGFITTITLLWQRLGYKMPFEAKHPIYFNHFCATAEVYKDYVNNFLEPAIKLTETDPEVRELMLADSKYLHLNKQADISNLKAIGFDYYPMVPFVLERCISLWLTMKKIKVDYL